MRKILKWTAYVVLILIFLTGAGLLYITFALPDVGEAKEMNIEITPERVERGKYLANHAVGCIDCHSRRDFSLFSGPVVQGTEGEGGMLFDEKFGLPGKLYAKNITPYNLKDWTDGEIYRLITTGVRKNGEPIFPLMPYPLYAQLAPEDIKSIIAYLRTLKPIEKDIPESSVNFPLNFIMRTIPQSTEGGTKPDKKNTVANGKYLVTGGGCTDCHTPMKDGERIEEMYLAGGNSFALPTGGVVTSANLTPDKETGLGSWSKEMFIQRFKHPEQPHNKRLPVTENAFNTIMPWESISGMTEEDLGAIYDYLRTVKPVNNQVKKFKLNATH